MATSAATGIQSALGRCSPKAIATAIDTATARITANRITGRGQRDRCGVPGQDVGSGLRLRCPPAGQPHDGGVGDRER